MKKRLHIEEFYELHPTFLFEGLKRRENDCDGEYDNLRKIYQLPDGLYLDYILYASWQLGGNSGQIRYVVKVTKPEIIDLMESSDEIYDANDVEISLDRVHEILENL